MNKQILQINAASSVGGFENGVGSQDIMSDGSDATYIFGGEGCSIDYDFEAPIQTDTPLALRFWFRAKQYSTVLKELQVQYQDSTLWGKQIVVLSEFFEDYYIETTLNDGGAALAWQDVVDSYIRLKTNSDGSSGAIISQAWVEVITGAASDPILDRGVMFGGVTDDQIKVWCRLSAAGNVKIRYGTVLADVLTNAGDTLTTAGTSVNSSTDYTCITIIPTLSADTMYYFDILVDDQSIAALESDNPFWSTLPNCKTFQTDGGENAFSFITYADRHLRQKTTDTGAEFTIPTDSAYQTIRKFNPAFALDLGDHCQVHATPPLTYADVKCDDLDVIRNCFKNCRGHQLPSTHYSRLTDRVPIFYIWSDHDYCDQDGDKRGGDGSFRHTERNLQGVKEYFPLPTLSAPADITGTATGGSATTLINTGVDFTTMDLHAGMVICRSDIEVGAISIIKEITATTLTFNTGLSGGYSFSAGDPYYIKKGGLWYSFQCGNAEFFVIDSRYKRDPNGTVNGDMLDGRAFGSGANFNAGGGTGTGHVQRDWLVNAVNNSTAKWKFICCDVPFKHDEPGSNGNDSWGSYDANDSLRNYLMTNIVVPNVIWLSGDRHHCAVDDASNVNDKWPHVICGTLGGGVQPINANHLSNGVTSSYLPASGEYSFTKVDVSEKSITIGIYDQFGALVDQGQVKMSEYDITDNVYFNADYIGHEKGSLARPFNDFNNYNFDYANADCEVFIKGDMGVKPSTTNNVKFKASGTGTMVVDGDTIELKKGGSQQVVTLHNGMYG